MSECHDEFQTLTSVRMMCVGRISSRAATKPPPTRVSANPASSSTLPPMEKAAKVNHFLNFISLNVFAPVEL